MTFRLLFPQRARIRLQPPCPLGLLGLLGLCLLWTSPARAQPGVSQVDTTSAERVIAGLRPKYETGLNVTLQQRAWIQSLTFGLKKQGWDFNNLTSFEITEDIFQNTNGRNGSSKTVFGLKFIPELPITTTLNLNRRSSDGFTSSKNDQTALTASTRYNTRLYGAGHNFTFSGGWDRSSRESQTQGNDARTRDSGITGKWDYKLTWITLGWLKLNGGVSVNRDSKDSEALAPDGGTIKLPTTAARDAANIKVDYEPFGWITADASLNFGRADNTKFTPISGQTTLEFQKSDDRSSAFNIRFMGLPGTTLTWTMGTSSGSKLYGATNPDPIFNFIRDRSNTADGSNWKGAAKSQYLGFNLEANLSEIVNDTNVRSSFPQQKISRLFEARAERKLGLKWDTRLAGRVDLRQTFQTTEFASQKQDFDEFRTKVEAGVGYRPSAKWTVNMSWVADNFQRIEQNPRRATNTKDEVVASISTRIGYNISSRTTLSQTYNIQARYEEFLFAQSNNRSRINRRIETDLGSFITPRLFLEFSHQWQHLKTGGFGFQDNGARIVFPASQSYTQDLWVTLEWEATSWLKLRARENFVRKDNLRESSGVWTTTARNLFLYEGFTIETPPMAGLTFRADGEYIRSNTRESYWILNSRLTKDF